MLEDTENIEIASKGRLLYCSFGISDFKTNHLLVGGTEAQSKQELNNENYMDRELSAEANFQNQSDIAGKGMDVDIGSELLTPIEESSVSSLEYQDNLFEGNTIESEHINEN